MFLTGVRNTSSSAIKIVRALSMPKCIIQPRWQLTCCLILDTWKKILRTRDVSMVTLNFAMRRICGDQDYIMSRNISVHKYLNPERHLDLCHDGTNLLLQSDIVFVPHWLQLSNCLELNSALRWNSAFCRRHWLFFTHSDGCEEHFSSSLPDSQMQAQRRESNAEFLLFLGSSFGLLVD